MAVVFYSVMSTVAGHRPISRPRFRRRAARRLHARQPARNDQPQAAATAPGRGDDRARAPGIPAR